jgi:cysteine desulfurase
VALISLLWASNEVGTIQPIAEIAALAARYSIPLHVDAVAAYGHLPLDFAEVRRVSDSRNGVGLVAMSLSAHKIGGPVGIGALVLSRDASIVPLIHGGGQQRQVRSGTQDVAATVAFATAATINEAIRPDRSQQLAALRDRLVRGVADTVPQAQLNGVPGNFGRLPGNAHYSFPGCEGDSLLFLLDRQGIAVSTGSACQAGVPEPSHVLRAMGRTTDEARGALRITLGHGSTESDIDTFLQALPHAYTQAAHAGWASREPGSGVLTFRLEG